MLVDLLIKNGAIATTREDGTRKIIVDSDIELVEESLVDTIVDIDGFPVASLACIRKFKVSLSRPKDLDDIMLIDNFMNSRTE